MTKKKTEPVKTTTNNSKALTILAIIIGSLLVLAGLALVIVKLIEADQEPFDCCTVYPSGSSRPRNSDPDRPGLKEDKPILYLYPEKETEVSVHFARPELLTTTYPKYNNEWRVVAQPNGDLRDIEGKYYYGLYWEKREDYKEFSDGFYVEKDKAIEFLEEKLETLGLNDRERNEFIMYWLPILEKNEKSFVHFELTDELQAENALIISPAPDSLLRIDMTVQKIEEDPKLPEQKLPSFERKGFAAVEWGGVSR